MLIYRNAEGGAEGDRSSIEMLKTKRLRKN